MSCLCIADLQPRCTIVHRSANAGRPEAYGQMIAHGYRAAFVGVAMQQNNEPGYNRPGAYIVDDWR